MSATGRSNVRDPDDNYATPPWVTQLLLPYLALQLGTRVLDPCCSEGAILRTLPTGVQGIGIELDAGRAATARAAGFSVTARDALAPEPWPTADVVITNPPYRLALQFVQRALAETGMGTVAMLLRLNWLGSQARADFHRQHPSDVCVLSKRPSFVNGRTDATEYSWLLWGPGRGGRWGILGPSAPRDRGLGPGLATVQQLQGTEGNGAGISDRCAGSGRAVR